MSGPVGLSADLAELLACSKSFDHPEPPGLPSELLLIRDSEGDLIAKPRCSRHPAAADARMINRVMPHLAVVVLPLIWAEVQGGPDHSAGCASPPECGRLDAQALGLPEHPAGYWCHAMKGHKGDHVLGH